jgi:excinuclease UvrABC ATPase subunit
VIEHDLDVVAAAVVAGARADVDDPVGGGHDGGTVVFAGPPRELLDADGSLTGQHLEQHLSPTT